MLCNTRPGTLGRLARVAAWLTAVAVLAGTQFVFAPSASAQGYVPISGAGSTWSSNALDQWRRNVDQNNGIKVNFAANGSSDGRNQFKNGTVDFAVSEIEYGLSDGGVVDFPPANRTFGYMPIVAGGTAFMYNLKIGNTRVTDLRLSGEVLAKIFTQQITNWSDPAIKADNPGLTLPARKIVPVVRSDGSGTTAQFTRWLAARHAGIWDAYCDKAGKRLKPCGFTSFYPITGGIEAKSGSQGVAGFVAQNSSEGSITYVEYSYARNAKFPVAKVLNEAGYYVGPTAGNVAVALLQAVIRPDLTSDLGGVYTDGDKRTYPLSSYSYLILPKNNNQNFSDNKGRTLAEFAAYFLCEGQQQAEALGYSPLPINLVKDGVDQVSQIPGADGASVRLNRDDLRRCNNPTFSPDGTNLLARNAPQPSECDRRGGPAQCNTGPGGNNSGGNNSGSNNSGGNNSGSNNSGSNNTGGNNTGGNNTGGNNTGGNNTGNATLDPETGLPPGATAIDPETGQLVSAGSAQTASSGASAIPVSVDLPDDGQRRLLAVLAVILLVALVLGPPLVSRNLSQRGKS
ncbi:MAG: phosphate ABC transporter substrate-binding protein PstS [Pseudonocardiaceae bacterium]